jgi:aspartate/methionine/tyrosine aminotransferase
MPSGCLTFRLGGLSKSAGLPQVKLGWIAVSGPDALVTRAMDHLELIADTYLSVSTPVQLAAARLIAGGAAVRSQIAERVRRNYASLRAACRRHAAIEPLHADGGWSAVLRVPATRPEEALTIEMLERDGVLVHPGFFFDFASEAYLVVSLLPRPELFDEGIRRVLERADG